MAVQLLCPNRKCRKILSVPEDIRGKLVRCQYCHTMIRVPLPKHEAGAGGASASSTR